MHCGRASFSIESVSYSLPYTLFLSASVCVSICLSVHAITEQLVIRNWFNFIRICVIVNDEMKMKLPILPCAEKLELVLSTAPWKWFDFGPILLRPGRGVQYCDQFVCLSVCLSVCVSV